MTIRCWICHRLLEPSTWVAMAIPLGIWAGNMPDPYKSYIYTATFICTAIGIIFKENRNAQDTTENRVGEGDGKPSNKPVAGKPSKRGAGHKAHRKSKLGSRKGKKLSGSGD